MLRFPFITLLLVIAIRYSNAGSCTRMQILGEKLIALFNQFDSPLQKLVQQLRTVEQLLEDKCEKALDDYKTCKKFLDRASSLESDLEGKCSKLRDLGGSQGTRQPYFCPTDWINNGSYCYRLMQSVEATWESAESACMSMGAHLASIHSAVENSFIMSLPGINSVYGSGANSLVANAWIGLRKGGHWQWSDGTLLDYQQWGPMYPTWSFENCGQLVYRHLNNANFGSSILSRWNNFACSMPVQNAVCKMKATPAVRM
ncbi:C-type lectin domain family 4 member A [Toxocara canis]|uniref:C-type lectin domain family 4 member A n=1 Tax=Toxocara canis TaxID=6265 RepID=A0A0B2UY79_TOXCA|nr:C-type lectin domain family 4 member A [Toxocara canis]